MNYLITTNYYPKDDYDLDRGQFIKIVKNPYNIDNIEEFKKGKLNILNGQLWIYSITIPDSYQYINDLVLFHSFITNGNQTYHYAENANKLMFEDNELVFINDRGLIKGGGGKIEIVDFNKFPLLMNCNRIASSERKFKYIDYKTSFEKFLELKTEQVKGLAGKYNLYDLICLYEFARSFEITHRIYRNANLPLSLYITILDSLIGKPESCSTKLHCDDCGVDIQEHKKISFEKHFTKYFKQFKPFRNIRHKTFHGGSFFDFVKYFSDKLKSEINWTDNKTIHLYQHEREEMECIIRILLTGEFYNYCKNEIKASSNTK